MSTSASVTVLLLYLFFFLLFQIWPTSRGSPYPKVISYSFYSYAEMYMCMFFLFVIHSSNILFFFSLHIFSVTYQIIRPYNIHIFFYWEITLSKHNQNIFSKRFLIFLLMKKYWSFPQFSTVYFDLFIVVSWVNRFVFDIMQIVLIKSKLKSKTEIIYFELMFPKLA